MVEDNDAAMMAMMGFSGFSTTKGEANEENILGPASGAVSKHKARKYRQYMNRRGGFNRPLQKMN
jgi:U4/U6.U5 tri-snRNP-associated protein 3